MNKKSTFDENEASIALTSMLYIVSFVLRLSMSLVRYREEENRCTVLDEATTNDCKAIVKAQLNDDRTSKKLKDDKKV